MTSLTKVNHRTPYPAIDPSSPPNSQAGKTILITGSTIGIGFETARAFAIASAARVIILGRSQDKIATAIQKLETWKPAGNTTKFIPRQCDIANSSEVEALWQGFKSDGVNVDVLILNSAKSELLGVNAESKKVWEFFEINVLANLRMAETFLAQGPETGKAIINVSSKTIHIPPLGYIGAYTASKASFTYLLQYLAGDVQVDHCQILSVHPGTVFTEGAQIAGCTEDMFEYDSVELPAAWCVWASTKQASYLHGRFLWSTWGVDELLEMKDRFEDPSFLRIGVNGVVN